MKKYILLFLLGSLSVANMASAQGSYNERAKKYVQDHYIYAIEEQRRSGIPAAITLAQGILETDAGASELMVNANNHFGIKCKGDWQGPTYAHDDDAPGECFKKYNSTLESYKDHSDLLHRNPRYAPLFKIDQKNYAGWAMCLRKCGYATNPQYGQRLTKIVEEFGLQEYTFKALDNTFVTTEPITPTNESPMAVTPAKYELPVRKQPVLENTMIVPVKAQAQPAVQTQPAVQEAKPVFMNEMARPAVTKTSNIIVKNLDEPVSNQEAPIKVLSDSAWKAIMETEEEPIVPQAAPPRPDSGKIVTVNNLKAFYARKGENLLQYAVKYNIRYPQLLEMNDLPDAALPFDTYVYLQKKHSVGLQSSHTVKQGENTLMISQLEGIQLKRLRALNHLNENDEPVVGAVLELQGVSDRKPLVKTTPVAAHASNAIRPNGDTSKAGYITLNRPKPNAGTDTAHNFIGNPQTTAKTTPGTQPRGIIKPGTMGTKPITPLNPIDSAAMAAKIPDTVFGIDEKRDWAAMHWVTADTEKVVGTKTVNVKQANAANAELVKLKAALDKIVYADNSSLISAEPQYQRVVPTSATAKTYTVKKGDTAFSIAKKNNITVDQLLKWNGMSAKDIKVGKILKVSN